MGDADPNPIKTASPPPRWLIYALGGGWGHLNRAIALARWAPHPVEILVNSPYSSYISNIQTASLPPSVQLHRLPDHVSAQQVPAYVQAWVQVWEAHWHDFLLEPESPQVSAPRFIVDTFPRGLVGDLVDLLPQLRSPCVLVHRDLNPHYIATKHVTEFVRQHYDLVLIPGEAWAPLAHLPQARLTPPWLLRDAYELNPMSGDLRHRFQLPSDRPLILVCATGRPPESALFGQLTEAIAQHYPGCTVRCLAAQCPPNCPPQQWLSHWPGIDVLQFADVVIGGAGYNLTYECAALGMPLLSLPLHRQYDRQTLRAAMQNHWVKTVTDGVTDGAVMDGTVTDGMVMAYVEAIAPLLSDWPHRSTTFKYANGVHAALDVLNLNLGLIHLGLRPREQHHRSV